MLYDRWREVARERSSETALRDSSSGRSWTFSQLLTISDNGAAPADGWMAPRGHQPEFIFQVLQAWRHERVLCPLEPNDPIPSLPLPPPKIVHVKRTSATTGPARHVAFTAEQIAADPANIVATMGLRPEWPNLGIISLAHSYGFSNLVLPLLLHGIPLTLVNSPLPEALRAALQAGDAFTLPAVPALWRAWDGADVLSTKIKLAISAGAPLPLPLEVDIFNSAGVKVHNFLGASECGGIAFDGTNVPRPDPALAGTPLERVQLDVGSGVLEVRGPAVAESYWPEAADGPRQGVFQTSDLAELRDGSLYLRGRATDLMNIAGRKVAPEEIERAILTHAAVQECVVFDAPRPGEENQIVTVLVAPGAELKSIKQHLASSLAAWQLPRQWFFVESLGVNERGKISRAVWRKRFLAGEI